MKTKEKLSKEIIGISLILVFGILPPMFDATIINIAINDFAKIFSIPFSVVQWIVTGYVLAMGVAVPFSGWLMNKMDSKKIFLYSLGLFLLSSLFSGLSWNIHSLIFFRILQGFASGLLMPILTTMVMQLAGGDKIGRMMSIVGFPIILGPILGPIIGGTILQYLNWQWLFFINIPLGIIALALIYWKVPAFEPTNKNSKLDLVGILMLAVSSASIIYGIAIHKTMMNNLWLYVLSTGVAILIAYVFYARRKNENAIIPLSLFKLKNFDASFVALFLAGFANNGPMLLLPMFLQNVRGLDVITSALWLIPQGIGMLITRSITGRFIDNIGARWITVFSIIITLIGTIPFVYFDNSTSQWLIWAILLTRGMGLGSVTISIMSDSYTGLEKQQIPQASIATRIIQNVGAAFGSGILAIIVNNAMLGKEKTIANITNSYHSGFLMSLVFMVIMIIPALFLTNKLSKK
jgi:EmrB/QacA subfamily drug resistance transporter